MSHLNRDSYDRIAERWNAHRVQLSSAEVRILSMLVDKLAPDSTILDLGCGTGQPVATHLAASGYRIIGVDQSPGMLEFARNRLPTHQWILAEIENFPFDAHCGAALAWDSLFHLPRERHEEIFVRLRGALPLGGRLALTAGGSNHPPFTDSMFDHDFFYDSHPPAGTLEALARAGFCVEHHEYLNIPDGAGDRGRIAVVAAAV